ncbi:MAG: ATP synthase F1 subunit gamma [Coriobacteriales bacterium]|jgi:F-type H+-transporting ATPase subunit gamma|nr:ATP synthase F1 subunit gamma [Coriobacteriales bacterium]
MAGNRAEIRSHIKSVTQTRKITDAMQLISGVMLTKERANLKRVGVYSREVRRVVRDALANCEDIEHPYLRRDGVGRRYVIYMGSDMGMCGSFNANLTRYLVANVPKDVELHVLGTNQYRMIASEGFTIANEPTGSSERTAEEIKAIADTVLERFASGELSEVDVLYTRFVNPVMFEPTLLRLLPFTMDEDSSDAPHYVYLEPDPVELVGRLVALMVETTFYSAFVESRTSEQASRQLAMKSATDNANELVDKLTLQYNQARQAEITQEISEIVGGADAL